MDERFQRNRDGVGGFKMLCKCGARRVDQQIGLEATPEEWVQRLVEVFREVRRCLHPTGVLFVNCGDAYWGGKGENGSSKARATAEARGYKQSSGTVQVSKRGSDGRHPVIEPKDLIGLPWMLAFALRADGWWLRSAITLCKAAPMPESVTDRPTSATEMMFMLTKQARYFYDAEAVRVPSTQPLRVRCDQIGGLNGADLHHSPGAMYDTRKDPALYASRNLWNYWVTNPEPLDMPHFAAMPTAWVRPCVLAGSSERGVCPASGCGAPWERVVEASYSIAGVNKHRTHPREHSSYIARSGQVLNRHNNTTGWRPTCSCGLEPVPATILDPFCGSGTTGVVAMQYGRRFIGVELSSEYITLAHRRMAPAAAQEVMALEG